MCLVDFQVLFGSQATGVHCRASLVSRDQAANPGKQSCWAETHGEYTLAPFGSGEQSSGTAAVLSTHNFYSQCPLLFEVPGLVFLSWSSSEMVKTAVRPFTGRQWPVVRVELQLTGRG